MSRVWSWADRTFGYPPSTLVSWFNFDTEEYDWIDGIPDDMIPYLPKGAARNLFRLYVEHKGYTPLDAALEVLDLSVRNVAGEWKNDNYSKQAQSETE